MSPIISTFIRRRSLRKIDEPAFPDHRDLDLPRIGQLLLDLLGQFPRELKTFRISEIFLLDDYANFPSSLNGIGFLDALVDGRQRLQLFQPLYIGFQRLATGARPRS